MFVPALKNVLRRKSITVPVLAGIGPGSALVLVLLSLAGGLNRSLDQAVGALAGRLVVPPKDAFLGGIYFLTFAEQKRKKQRDPLETQRLALFCLVIFS